MAVSIKKRYTVIVAFPNWGARNMRKDRRLMMRHQLSAKPIVARTKGAVKRLRLSGFTPISIQHRGQETRHYQEETRPLHELIQQYGKAALLEMIIAPDNKQETVIIHEVQRDPLTNRLLHVTYQSVHMDEAFKVHVRLVVQGEPDAVKLGTARVQQPVEMLEIRCLPANLPDHLTVNISHLAYGDVLRVSDLPVSEKYEMLTPGDTVLISLGSLTNRSTEEETESASKSLTAAEEATLAA
jgi:large subunit ribosomal protein L25